MLDDLYKQTTFAQDKQITWEDIKVEKNSIFVPQGSYFGSTLISLGDTYERSGEDCLFIQELVRLYKEGKLKHVT